MTAHNVNAVLVHERPDVVADLVRNLRHLDPDSTILLYNGGRDPRLLDERFADPGVLVHPKPKPLEWGKLHDFALDCMRFSLDSFRFDTLTIVDSDQLAARPGYSRFLAEHLAERDRVGMLGNAPGVQPPTTRIGPPAAAVKELELWRPFLRRFPDGEQKFPHWTFWPSTVFTADASRALVDLFANDAQLAAIMRRSKIWATEEVILPTLVALLGFSVERNPCSYEYVKYNARYTPRQLAAAFARRDVYWLHPIPRRDDDVLRRRVRARHSEYAPLQRDGLSAPIIRQMRRVEGWLEDDEADLLVETTANALRDSPGPHTLVEIGSFCGRATVVLGKVAKALEANATVVAIDPHDGTVGALDQRLVHTRPTLSTFTANVAAAGVDDIVETVVHRAPDVRWTRPVHLLLVDGLHDYASASRDFWHFEEHITADGFVAFHDYAEYFPGVKQLVHEVLSTGRYRRVRIARSLVVLQKVAAIAAGPLVTCVLPTFDRPRFAARAVEYFLRQDYEPKRLVVVDDSAEAMAHLLPDDPRVEYVRFERRRTIGAKRNAGCETSDGELIANWDDDDWIAPTRLSAQVAALMTGGGDVCGLSRMLYYEPSTDRAWRYVYPWDATRWASDGTLLFTRELWRTNPFPDTSVGIDIRWLRDGRFRRLVPLEDEDVYVGMIHRGNTSAKHTSRSVWHPLERERIHDLLGADLSFYRATAAAMSVG